MPININILLRHDVQLIFGTDDQDAIGQILALVAEHAEGILNAYEHTLNAQRTWIADRWSGAVKVGYLTQNALNPILHERSEWLAGGESEVAPITINLGNADDTVQRRQYLYLFSPPPNWNLSRPRYVPPQLAGAAVPGPHGQQQINSQVLQRIFTDIERLKDAQPDSLEAAVRQIFDKNGFRFGKVSSVLLHLVWPHIFPVWFLTTGDGYSQVKGMRKLLNEIKNVLPVQFWVGLIGNFENDYFSYARVYRLVLHMYRRWLAAHNSRPPHFDFVTEMLANLAPRAVSGQLLKTKKALILYGVPGTGKTHKALELAQDVVGGEYDGRVKTVQFHPGYSYADFVIGIRPVVSGIAVIYEVRKGILYECAERAAANQNQNFCLVIDEINRANLSETLGEAMFCLEYRGPGNCISLPQTLSNTGVDDPFDGGQKFYIPCNLYIIGTMNHADRSISGFDMALRRRFAWYKMEPMTWVGRDLAEKNLEPVSLAAFLDAAHDLNACISEGRGAPTNDATRIPLNEDHQIGDSYFAAINKVVEEDTDGDTGQVPPRQILPQHRERLWLYYIEPLLEDFLGSDAHAYRDALTELGQRFIGPY